MSTGIQEQQTHGPAGGMVPSSIEVVPTSPNIGADIIGVDLSQDVDDATIAAIKSAWHAHLILRIRDQHLTPGQLSAFSRRFGELELAPTGGEGTFWVEGHQDVLVLSNVVEDGKLIGALGNHEAQWHTDMSYNDVPPLGSHLYAVEVPETGGNTGFLNMYMAYETLPDETKARLDGMNLKHDAGHDSAGNLRKGRDPVSDLTTSLGAIHPIVRTHPAGGRKALFLGRRRTGYSCGLALAESEELLDFLWAHCDQERFTWHQEWQVGDLIMWDNRCAMHRRDAFSADARRIMHRTQVAGDKPY
jgi:taurine dioxygenase